MAPAFTKTVPMRVGHWPTIMSVGSKVMLVCSDCSVTVTWVWPAKRSAAPASGT